MTECDAQARGCARRIIEVVIIKDHVHFVRFLGELLTPFRDFPDFIFGIIVIEARGHGFSRQISAGVAAVQSQIGKFRARNLIQIGWHDREMFGDGRIVLIPLPGFEGPLAMLLDGLLGIGGATRVQVSPPHRKPKTQPLISSWSVPIGVIVEL